MVAINSLLQTPLIKLTVIWQVKARFFILHYPGMAIAAINFQGVDGSMYDSTIFLTKQIN
jgi:hypothetical protein